MRYELVDATTGVKHPREQAVLRAIMSVFPMHDAVHLEIEVCDCGHPDVHLRVRAQVAFSWWDYVTFRRQKKRIIQAVLSALRQPSAVYVRKMPGSMERAAARVRKEAQAQAQVPS